MPSLAPVQEMSLYWRIMRLPNPVIVPFGYLHVPVQVPFSPLLHVEFVPSEVTVQVPDPPSQ